MNRALLALLAFLIAAGVIGGAAYYRYRHPLLATSQPTTHPSTASSTLPATVAVKVKPPPGPTTQLLDILHAKDPKYPTTQRLSTSLDLKYAARIILDDPLYLDQQGNLWITRADAPATFNFLNASASPTATQVVRDVVVFVLWDATENGKWLPHLVVKNPAGGYALLDYDGRRALPDPYGFDWTRALVLLGRPGEKAHVVVPTRTGACAFAFDDAPDQILSRHRQLIDPESKDAPDRAVQLVMDVQGVIAYVTNLAGNRGGKGIARFAPLPSKVSAPAQYQWSALAGWPDQLLYLVPLLDGSVLQVASVQGDEADKVAFSLNTLAPVTIDQKLVLKLIDQLSDPDPDQRDQAFKSLTTYGPGIAPIMEKVLEEQPVEAQIRIRQLLKNKIEPSLGGMSLVDGRMRVVNRLPDGGIVFYAEAGVAIPRPDDAPSYVSPAWLLLRPGRAVELLPKAMVADLQPDKQKIIAWGPNDYIVNDPVLGPQWYIGNHLEPLLHKAERRFTEFTGIDATGRWIFYTPALDPSEADAINQAMLMLLQTNDITPMIFIAPATQPSILDHVVSSTTRASTQPSAFGSAFILHPSSLIIDPFLPDPTPPLPSWELPPSVGKVGWDKDNWPVIYMDVKPDPVPWALAEDNWRVIEEKKETVYTVPPPLQPPSPTTRPATTTTTTTTPSTQPTTQHSALSTQDFLLATPDGTRYYDGRNALKLVMPDGQLITWPLPQSAIGAAKPTLLRSRENLLFLFNEPGRIVRIRPTPDADQPFTVEAIFTRNVPSDPTPQRIWLDPADRICIAHDQNRITIFFPIGRIPPAIAEKMRPEDFPPDQP